MTMRAEGGPARGQCMGCGKHSPEVQWRRFPALTESYAVNGSRPLVPETTWIQVPQGWVVAPIDLSGVGGPRFTLVQLCSFECAARYLGRLQVESARRVIDTADAAKALNKRRA